MVKKAGAGPMTGAVDVMVAGAHTLAIGQPTPRPEGPQARFGQEGCLPAHVCGLMLRP